MSATNNTNDEDCPMARPATSQDNEQSTYDSVSTPSPNMENASIRQTDLNNTTIEYIPPINYSIPTNSAIEERAARGEEVVTPKMVTAYQYSGAIKCLTLFDIFMIIIYSISYPFVMFIWPFPIIGYYGANHYEIRMTQVYLVFQVFTCLGSAYTINSIAHNNNDDTENKIGLNFVNLFFNLYFIFLTWKYIVSLSDLTESELTSLRDIKFIENSLGSYRYW